MSELSLYRDMNPDHIKQMVERGALKPFHESMELLEETYEDPVEKLVMKVLGPAVMYGKIRESLKKARKLRAYGSKLEGEIRDTAIDMYRNYLDGAHTSRLSKFTVKPMKEYLFVSYVGGKGPLGFVLGPMRVLGHRVNPGEICGAVKDSIKKCGKGVYQKLNR